MESNRSLLFEPFTMNNVTFKNRLIRSSIGGRTSYYDGTVSPVWRNFEKRFAAHGVSALISPTISVDDRRWSPLEYPKLSQDKFIKPLRAGVQAVQSFGCHYIIQLGDPGAHTQMSLFPQKADSLSASRGFDFMFGYSNLSTPMTAEEIGQTIENFAQAARRARETGCDGLEVTASKGYLIHQFLNPATNRRTDGYGGSLTRRFRFLQEVVQAVRAAVGPDLLFGVRLSAIDRNWAPLNLRWPPVFPLRRYVHGNGLPETTWMAQRLERLGVDYLHISSGYGFINPTENPGDFPVDEFIMYTNSMRHLSAKANLRATVLNAVPRPLLRKVASAGWEPRPAGNAAFARAFKEAVGIPIIANGGFQARDLIESALADGTCDLVSMARPLLANPDLLQQFESGRAMPANPCTFCNRCAARTANFPLGCYEPKRFTSQDEMEAQILAWSANPEE